MSGPPAGRGPRAGDARPDAGGYHSDHAHPDRLDPRPGVRRRAGHGHRDAGDAGLQDVTVFIDANGNGALDAGEQGTVTQADGSFTLGGLAAGGYRVAVAGPAGGGSAPVAAWPKRRRPGRGGSARQPPRAFGLTQTAVLSGRLVYNPVGSGRGAAGAPPAPPCPAGPSTWTSTTTAAATKASPPSPPPPTAPGVPRLGPGPTQVRVVPRRHSVLNAAAVTLMSGPLAAGDVVGDVVIGLE